MGWKLGAIDYTLSSYIPTILCSVDTFMLIRFTLAGPFVASLRGETYQFTTQQKTKLLPPMINASNSDYLKWFIVWENKGDKFETSLINNSLIEEQKNI